MTVNMNSRAARVSQTIAIACFLSVTGTSTGETLDAAAEPSPFVVSFSPTTVNASGVTKGARVVVFSVAQEPRYYYSEVVRRVEILTDNDGDGQIEYSIPKGIPQRAIWAIVDLTTGRHHVQPTPGYEVAPHGLSQAQVRSDAHGQLKKFELPFSELEALLVRPGEGAWLLHATKNSTLDENRGTEAPIRVDLELMEPVEKGPSAPKAVKRGDILVCIDPQWMEYTFMEVQP